MASPIRKRLWSSRSGGAQEHRLYSGATVLGNADLALILDPGSIA
jgi:chemotaxis protein histidine kinase CheA